MALGCVEAVPGMPRMRFKRSSLTVTNFIFQKAKSASLFSRFAASCGYKLYFVITLLWLENKVCNRFLPHFGR